MLPVIVTRQVARRIAAGRQTQIRLAGARRSPAVLANIPVSYRVPCQHGLRKMDTLTACRVVVLDAREQRLLDASDEDAKAEGYRDRRQLVAAWGGSGRNPRLLLVRFTLDTTEQPRYLSRAVVAGRQGAYTSNQHQALPDEPEAVSDEVLDEFTAQARARDAHRRTNVKRMVEQMTLEQQVTFYELEARKRHIDIRSELRAFWRWTDPELRRKQLDAIRRAVEPSLLAAA